MRRTYYVIRNTEFNPYVVVFSDGTTRAGFATGYDAHGYAQSVGHAWPA